MVYGHDRTTRWLAQVSKIKLLVSEGVVNDLSCVKNLPNTRINKTIQLIFYKVLLEIGKLTKIFSLFSVIVEIYRINIYVPNVLR